MNQESLLQALKGIPLGAVYYYESIGSTNDETARLATAGAPDLTLVLANEQVAGRGRLGRRWYTPTNSALAFSLVLRVPDQSNPALGGNLPNHILRHTALGALAVCHALEDKHLSPKIKWPNDVLLGGRKICGVLTEASWQGNQVNTVVLGIGVNVTPSSIPPYQELLFPATCIEDELAHPVERMEILRTILAHLLHIHTYMAQAKFINEWQEHLALRGEWVRLTRDASNNTAPARVGKVLGLDQNGYLCLQNQAGEYFTVSEGELSLRPMEGC
jgi:BirA family biotin operon repressor/biotin-[acetyl-CoA-carboxylase] ligase